MKSRRHLRAGVFVNIDAEGLLSAHRGYVRPENEAPVVVEPQNETQRVTQVAIA